MELQQDIATVNTILGTTKDEEIREFLQKVPVNKNDLRLQVTLWNFLTSTPTISDDFEDDVNYILQIFPNILSKEDIINRLKILGNMSNRKEVVVRQLLHERRDELDPLLLHIKNRKRSLSNGEKKNETDEPALKIKITKNADNKLVCQPVENTNSETEEIDSQKTIEYVPDASNFEVVDNTSDISNRMNEEPTPSCSSDSRSEEECSSTSDIQTITLPYDESLPSTSKEPSALSNYTNPSEKLLRLLKVMTRANGETIQRVCQRNKLDLSSYPPFNVINKLVKDIRDEPEISSNQKEVKSPRIWVKQFGKASNIENVTATNAEIPPINTPQTPNHTSTVTKNKELRIFDNLLDLMQVQTQEPVLTYNVGVLNQVEPINFAVNVENVIEEKKIENDLDFEFNAAIETLQRHVRNDEDMVEGSKTADVVFAGPSTSVPAEPVYNEKIFLRLVEMFPDACPQYLRTASNGKSWEDVEDIVSDIVQNVNYPKRRVREPSPEKEVDPQEQFETLKEIFPDADPTFLHMQALTYANQPDKIKEFINDALEFRNYPTMKEYLRKQQLSAQQKQYTTDFQVENFIEIFPDPKATFTDPKRVVKMDDQVSKDYLLLYFRNKFDRVNLRTITNVLENHKYQVGKSITTLEKSQSELKNRRKHVLLPNVVQNIPMLQEIAYYEHRAEIEMYLEKKTKEKARLRAEAKENNLLQTCNCCYDDEVMLMDVLTCEGGCKFCRDCIKKSVEICMGESKIDFKCLSDCGEEFSLQTIQNVVTPKMFSKIAQKKALAEVKAAGIDDLESCPFCDFASIPAETDKIFRCLNPECMKESCRLCKEPSHVPLKCDEVEKDEDVKARTYVENKMSEALIRKCWKCGTKFLKESGCNKMTCSCGAKMCYICCKPVKDYTHFNGNGGDQYHLCPLFSDMNELHKQNVLKGAADAKAELGINTMKIDPTSDVAKHYHNSQNRNPGAPYIPILGLAPARFDHYYHHVPNVPRNIFNPRPHVGAYGPRHPPRPPFLAQIRNIQNRHNRRWRP